MGRVTRLGGLLGLLGRVTLSAGVTICHVNVSKWGNPLRQGRVHVTKRSNEPNDNETRVCLNFLHFLAVPFRTKTLKYHFYVLLAMKPPQRFSHVFTLNLTLHSHAMP